MGGTKRTIPMEKIKNKNYRAVAFTKRLNGLYSKTSKFCLLSGNAQVAILATPVSSNSNNSFYSFGHSSVDSVVSAFLSDQTPLPRQEISSVGSEKGLGFWWEDETLLNSENPKELSNALNAISSMLQNLKGLLSKAVKNQEDLKKKENEELGHIQTINLQSTSGSLHSQYDDSSVNLIRLVKNIEEKNQIVAFSDNNNNNNDKDNDLSRNLGVCKEEITLDQIFEFVDDVSGNQKLSRSSNVGDEDGGALVMMNRDLIENQTMAVSDNNSNNKDDLSKDLCCLNQKLDLDQTSVISSESPLICSGSESSEAGTMVIHSNSDEDQIIASSNNNNNNGLSDGDLYGCNQEEEVNYDQVFDFDSSSEFLSMNFEMDDVSTMMNTNHDDLLYH